MQGREALARHDPGGLEVLEASLPSFAEALAAREPHVEARADRSASLQRHRQRLLRRDPPRGAAVAVQADVEPDRRGDPPAVRGDARDAHDVDGCGCRRRPATSFPEKVTAFREGMAVHGRYGKPCPVCGLPVQRIVYAANEANYCVTCQTGGRLLADRSLSRLLREDWPRTLDELEQRKRGG